MISDRTLQDPLENERQLGRRARAVLVRQPQHRILDDIERRVLVADGEECVFVSAPLGAGEKIRQFFFGGQVCAPCPLAPAARS